MIRLALRFDDPSPTSNRDIEDAILGLCRSAAIPLTLAVVPFTCKAEQALPLTEKRAAHLVNAVKIGYAEVALHGYCHKPCQPPTVARPSEFTGAAEADQARQIAEGKRLLERVFSQPVSGFVPPWNSFDTTTTRVLARLGFGYISAGNDDRLPTRCARSISYLPRTCTIKNLPEVLGKLNAYDFLNPAVIAVMHHYDFVESGEPNAPFSLAEFGKTLDVFTRNHAVKPVTLGSLAQDRVGKLGNRRRQYAWRSLPWKIQTRLPTYALFAQSWPGLLVYSLLLVPA